MSQCIIFDCDGVLVDSERLCSLGLVLQLSEYRVDLDVEEVLKRYRGWKLAKILEDISGLHKLKLHADFESQYRKRVERLFDDRLMPVEGITEALSKIELPKCVASSGPYSKIMHSLRITGLSGYFGDRIYSSYDVGSWKPDPGLFIHAANKMGFAPTDCVVVEDSEVGVQAAKAAGMKVMWYGGIDDIDTDVRSFNNMANLPELLHITQRSSRPATNEAAA